MDFPHTVEVKEWRLVYRASHIEFFLFREGRWGSVGYHDADEVRQKISQRDGPFYIPAIQEGHGDMIRKWLEYRTSWARLHNAKDFLEICHEQD